MKEKTLCAIYTRVSTDNQAEIEFNSCEAQRNRIEHFIKSQDGFVVYDYFNDEGYTGANLDRPELQRMIREIARGNVNCVITYKMDRLTRSPRDFYQLIEFFEKYKVDFISVTERFDTSTPSGRLLRNIMLTFAQFERELASERTKDKLLQRAQKGLWNGGITALGYKSVDKKLVVVKREAKIVKVIYEAFKDTQSIAKVYNYLISKGYKDRNGKIFSKDQIRYILKNIIYIGKMKYSGRIYQGNHELIISEDLFNEVQQYHKPRKRKHRQYRTFLFKGLIKCSQCNRAMSPCFTSKKQGDNRINRFYYYRCVSTYKRDWCSCDIKQVSADKLENYIFDSLKKMSLDKHYLYSSSLNRDTRTGDVQNGSWSETDLKSLQKQIKVLLKAAEKSRGTERHHVIINYVKDVIYSKETIQVNIYWGTEQDNEQGIMGQASEKSHADTDDKRSRCSAGDDPRRSAGGRGAEGIPASEASSGVTEGVRLGEAERSSKKKEKPNHIFYDSAISKKTGSVQNRLEQTVADPFQLMTYAGQKGKTILEFLLPNEI